MYHRKCDLIECNKESSQWKVFRGCGHSFHIECVLPDTSVCKICESTLKDKLNDLGKVANDAVFNHDLRETVNDNEQESDEESNTDTDDGDDDSVDEFEVQPGAEEVDEKAINNLLRRIRMWQRADIP